ncbi:hypothetical protein ACHAWF_015934 [Thalassiosira exigua]
MAADAEAEGGRTQRERGTLKDTLPRRPIIIVALVAVISAALATALFDYSYSQKTTKLEVAELGSIAFLGSASTLLGITYGDSLSHVFAFGVAVLIMNHGDLASSITSASPPLLLAALASTKYPREIISSLDSILLFQPLILQTCCMVPFLTLLHQSLFNPTYAKFSSIPICTVAFLGLLLMHMFNKHRVHKSGCLLTPCMKSHAIFAGISIMLACSISIGNIPQSSMHILVVFLLGSLFSILMSCTFASVADVWYAVGSGQFQMVSLDTAGMMFFFVFPAAIIYFRFIDKYGESLASKASLLKGYLQSVGVDVSGEIGDDDTLTSSMVMTLALITAIGVPLLNGICPIGGYLFSRAYTHGQPNTKKAALCVGFADLGTQKRADLWKSLEKKESVLNIFVTLEDMHLHAAELKLLSGKGHAISLAPTEFKDTLCGLSMFQGNKSCNIQIAHHEYTELFGDEPSWVLAKSADSIGRHPAFLRVVKDLGMKVSYWSTHVEVAGNKLTDAQLREVREECSDKDGGSIIYVALGKGAPPSCMSSALSEIIDSLDGYSLESLSHVVRDDATMVL